MAACGAARRQRAGARVSTAPPPPPPPPPRALHARGGRVTEALVPRARGGPVQRRQPCPVRCRVRVDSAMRRALSAWWAALAWAAVGARELDEGACSARFDVQRDKIIRTEESRDMGAVYLSELDVGARAECLRLCCETDACDVFVYEEKGPGSCYLFNCGPPEDFRCKFTAHSNFSSGVMALSRRLAELQDQQQRAHREQELASLRSATSAPAPPTSSTTTTAPPAPALAPTPSPPASSPHPTPAPAPAGRCSRYQFECRRGGECIAVYNACDGVPQCADGSDEAPELGCPPPAPPRATPRAPPPPPPPPPAERWPHRLAQAQPPRRYSAESAGGSGASHIFSHKGGLVQEAESGAYSPFEPPAPWPRRAWPQPPPQPQSQPQPPHQQSGVDVLQLDGWGAGGGGGVYAHEWAPRAWPVPPAPRADPELPMYISGKTMPEVPVVYSSVQATLRDSAKKGPDMTHGAPEVGPAAPPPPPSPPPPAPPDLREERRPEPPHRALDKDKSGSPAATTGARHSEGVSSGGGAAAERHLSADEHDGLSEHPPAAVLLLVLGLALTGGMGGVVACRARAPRRRARRGKPLAHDADYLVNGMYL